MSHSEWKTVEDPHILGLERNFLAGDFVCGTCYGIQLLLYGACAKHLWHRRRMTDSKQPLFLLAYITVLLMIETIFAVVQAYTVQMIYIDYRNYPGTPWEFFLATQDWAVNVIFYASFFVLTFLSDLLVLWRCWVIWTASGRSIAYLVTAFPAVIILASFAMGTLWTLQSSQPGLSLYSALPMAYGKAYLSISLGANILLTTLIISRLLVYRNRVLATLPAEHAKHYVSLATIIIESAALYSLCAILFLVTYAVDDPTNQVFLGVASAAQQVAGYLIIFRLADGRAWQKNTLTMPSMHFRAGGAKPKLDRDRDSMEMSSPGHGGVTHLSTFHAMAPEADDESTTRNASSGYVSKASKEPEQGSQSLLAAAV